ncbi:serine/threonine-protein phosphatase CPPED1 isoform X1 [Fundulus heteroclitus]|uniref:serine/threonine-protein phosphatase CPPED1 isoform X1 n=1 Tax=Fundulus heteroclitus TaxID=8078 RepID=UPI00165C369B|nr:serine/threonine-protein phosphatase CPPED1 isoform X1 [Fundulus heteroclitus]
MSEKEDLFLRAKHRTFSGLTEDAERTWTGPFCFIQAADPQLGLMKAWREGDCDGGGDEWAEEVELTKQTVEAVNRLRPRPRFMVLCGDLVHAMPGTPFREGQERDLKDALKGTDPSIPLVFVSGNHDLGNTPTPSTVEQYCGAWGDDYFSFWVGGVLCLVLNSQLFYDASACPQLKEAQETWLEAQLSKASSSSSSSSSTEPKPKHILVFQHIPLYLKSPDEEDDYFNLQKEVRRRLLDRFKRAGVGTPWCVEDVLQPLGRMSGPWWSLIGCFKAGASMFDKACVGTFTHTHRLPNQATVTSVPSYTVSRSPTQSRESLWK